MKDLDPLVLLAVFQEMLGPLLWLLILLAVGGVAAFLALWIRERSLVSRRLVIAEMLGVLGGGVALVIMAKVSSSGFTDAGGPADWFLIATVYGVGLVGTTVLAYAVMGWSATRRRSATA